MDEMEKIVDQDLLFDFYGEMLTEHQKRIYREVVFNDYSVSEVARDEGISRQGISDMIRRCTKLLAGYEKKLGLVKRFHAQKQIILKISKLAEQFRKDGKADHIEKIAELSKELLKEE